MKKKTNPDKSKKKSSGKTDETPLEKKKFTIKRLIISGIIILIAVIVGKWSFSRPEKVEDIPTQPIFLKTQNLNYTIIKRFDLPEKSYAYTFFYFDFTMD